MNSHRWIVTHRLHILLYNMHTSENLTTGLAEVCNVHWVKIFIRYSKTSLHEINTNVQNDDGIWERYYK